jgi:hypothetical protein
MKKNLFILLLSIAFICNCQLMNAAKWRVNNISGIHADFTTAQAVNDSAYVLPGDTVYFEGSGASYGDLTLSKRLVIIGPGYFLNENDSTQANLASASLGTIFIYPGAENSVVTGIKAVGTLYLSCGNVLLKRNNLQYLYIGDAGPVSNNVVLQCWIYSVLIYSGCQNNTFKNNCFTIATQWQYAYYMHNNTSGLFLNNITNCRCQFYNCEVRNNIQVPPGGSARETWDLYGSSISTNNIAASNQVGSDNGNQSLVDMSTVFMYSGSTDGQYKLKPGSPAIGAGYEGVDCGVFGGPQPYILSGLPTVPAIWKLDVNGPTVTLKAKSH